MVRHAHHPEPVEGGRLGGILLINVVIIMRLLPVEDLFSLSANIADREKEARVYR
jgi:hypothetical protein